MKERKLKARTIVPQELYVERAADRQLREIIEEMGRPGYVLVARQMGKTNLLLHMKRQQTEAHVLYFDLSSRFESARHWFRNIIDGLLESLEESLPDAGIEIRRQRGALELEPNVEYDRHLRLILRRLNKKVIVILDEIDSLINTSYSDAIFAQIRSMYFSRATHPEYENLTYVLSGVVEPTELIRDKNISPFNIGEKIYLENFNRSEVDSFVQKSGVKLSTAVIDRLVEWTDGNPRMTWDITSELETYITREPVTVDTVDQIVQKLYLDQFDRPPVDHIRTLASGDKKIRDAIVAMRYGKGDLLDQNTKNKLYLAGVTGSAGGEIKIANRVVDCALSQEWLDSLDVTPAIAPVLLVFNRGDFRQAVSLLTELRASPDEAFSAHEQQLLAESHLNLGDYAAAQDEYENCLASRPSAEVKQRAHLGLGIALDGLGKVNKAREHFANAADGPSKDLAIRAMLYKASLFEGSESSLAETMQEIGALPLAEYAANSFVSVLQQYVLHVLAKKANQYEVARERLLNALAISEGEVHYTLQLAYASVLQDKRERANALKQLVSGLSLNFDDFPIGGDVDLSFGVKRLLELFRLLVRNGLISEAINLATSYGAHAFATPVSAFAAIKHLYSKVILLETPGSITYILGFAVRYLRPTEQPRSEYLDVLAEIIGSRSGPNPDKYRQDFINQLRLNYESTKILTPAQLHALAMLALKCMQDADWRFSREIFGVWNLYRDAVIDGGLNKLMLDFIQMRCLTGGKISSDITLRHAAERVIESYSDESIKNSDTSSKEITNAFRKEADEILKQPKVERLNIDDPFKGFGRNDRVIVQYGGAIPVEKKFKHVESDLRNGDCIFVKLVQKSKS